jgi:hypothetical protein
MPRPDFSIPYALGGYAVELATYAAKLRQVPVPLPEQVEGMPTRARIEFVGRIMSIRATLKEVISDINALEDVASKRTAGEVVGLAPAARESSLFSPEKNSGGEPAAAAAARTATSEAPEPPAKPSRTRRPGKANSAPEK